VSSDISDGQVSDGATPTTPLDTTPSRASFRMFGIFTRDAGSDRKRSSSPDIEITTSFLDDGLCAVCAATIATLKAKEAVRMKQGRAKRRSNNPDLSAQCIRKRNNLTKHFA
jgi:hypothetical protein